MYLKLSAFLTATAAATADAPMKIVFIDIEIACRP